MDENQIHSARTQFRSRLESLRRDLARAFWPINEPGAPPAAIFPAVMYCFSMVDYFSSFWEGWNDMKNKPAGRDQNNRMTDFLCNYLLYPKKEAFLAISVWRHKLMHTSEPRIVTSTATTPDKFVWMAGANLPQAHMRLQPTEKPNEFFLAFDCMVFQRDLEEGIFGPSGYFTALIRNETGLQANYAACLTEMDQYKIDFSKVGL
jgi:hypothetical protein